MYTKTSENIQDCYGFNLKRENNCCKDYFDHLYTWLIEVMLNCSSDYSYSYTGKISRVQWNSSLKERKKKSIDAYRVWKSHGKPMQCWLN